MNQPIRVLDTSALLGYAHQSNRQIPSQLAFCADHELSMVTSVLCVAEAFRDCDDEAVDLLDLLLSLPTIEIAECRPQDADVVGNVAKRVQRLSLAHSCVLVWQLDTPVMTTDTSAAGKVLDADLIWEI